MGDFLLQTEWQALNKHNGLHGGTPENRRALLSHVCAYALPFLPMFVWIADERDATAAATAAAITLLTHLVQDDGNLLVWYVKVVKKTAAPFGTPLWMAIDQSFHIFWIFLAALAATA